jgi:hypothetical protein
MHTHGDAREFGAQLHKRRVNGPVLKAQPPAARALSTCACGGGCPRCQGALDIQGRATTNLEKEKARGELFVDGGDTPRKSPGQGSGKSPGKGNTGGKGAAPAPTCPAQIGVAEVGTLQLDASMVEQGWLTGIGGYAKMEVSDPSGRNWNGTAIHENVSPFADSCGTADRSCSNSGGEGGDAGSTFTVGAAGDLLGLPLPAQRNSFYDIHVVAIQGASLLHRIGKSTCGQKCYQQYDCGGAMFGPAFLIDKLLYRDMIVGEGAVYDVTRVDLSKYTV